MDRGGEAFVCKVAATFAELSLNREAWDEAVLLLGGNIYGSYDWLKTWIEFYGEGKQLRLFVCSTGERIVAILPVYIDDIGFGPFKFRVARLVGANIPPKAYALTIEAAHVDSVCDAVLKQLFEADGCDVLSLGPIGELQQAMEPWRQSCKRNPLVGRLQTLKNVHTIFWTPESMDKYYEGLSKHEKKNRRKYELRMLAKEYDVKVDILTDPAQSEEGFDKFAKQHAEQWHEERKPGHFGSWPKALEYNRALVRAHARLGRMRFIRILANNEVIANQYTFAFGDAYTWELPSRAVDPKWSRFSLGPTAIVTMIECALKEGKKSIEGGLAHYDYKLRLGAKEYSANVLRITSSRPRSLKLLRVFGLLRRIADIVYRKVWYRRVAPKLPKFFWRPQPMWWLRLDF